MKEPEVMEELASHLTGTPEERKCVYERLMEIREMDLSKEEKRELTEKIKKVLVNYFLNRKSSNSTQTVGYGTHMEFNDLVKSIESAIPGTEGLAKESIELLDKIKIVSNKTSISFKALATILLQVECGLEDLFQSEHKGQIIVHVNEEGINVQVRQNFSPIIFDKKEDKKEDTMHPVAKEFVKKFKL